MAEHKCVLCEKEFSYTKNHPKWVFNHMLAYMERGISKKKFLCDQCYSEKLAVCNLESNADKKANAVASLQGKVQGKTITLQNVVNAWIEGEEKKYYSNTKGLVYCVTGPSANLFVFKDHLTILSAFQPSGDWSQEDYSLFYKCRVTADEHEKLEEVRNYFFCLPKKNISDLEKINGEIRTEQQRLYDWQIRDISTSIELNISLGEFGTLEFVDRDYSFEFYYHQNQLMEEVYNYIKKHMENPDADDTEGAEAVSIAQNTLLPQNEKKEDLRMVAYSPADEIRKMKELFDCGILSQEEFERAKNRLIDKL